MAKVGIAGIGGRWGHLEDGPLILSEMKKKGFNITELARKMGISHQALSMAFKRKTLRTWVLLRASDALEVDLFYLISKEARKQEAERELELENVRAAHAEALRLKNIALDEKDVLLQMQDRRIAELEGQLKEMKHEKEKAEAVVAVLKEVVMKGEE
jgi:transcriptional regulator with XRE-family HTH domain